MAHSDLRLPKLLLADPRADGLLEHLQALAQPLWEGGKLEAPTLPLTDALVAALQNVRRAGRMSRGLEATQRTLDAEAHGQRLADENGGQARAPRVSRLVLLSHDGAERFYRQVEAMLRKHEGRVLALRLEVGADALGTPFFGEGALARLLFIDHKAAVAKVLLAVRDAGGLARPRGPR